MGVVCVYHTWFAVTRAHVALRHLGGRFPPPPLKFRPAPKTHFYRAKTTQHQSHYPSDKTPSVWLGARGGRALLGSSDRASDKMINPIHTRSDKSIPRTLFRQSWPPMLRQDAREGGSDGWADGRSSGDQGIRSSDHLIFRSSDHLIVYSIRYPVSCPPYPKYIAFCPPYPACTSCAAFSGTFLAGSLAMHVPCHKFLCTFCAKFFGPVFALQVLCQFLPCKTRATRPGTLLAMHSSCQLHPPAQFSAWPNLTTAGQI